MSKFSLIRCYHNGVNPVLVGRNLDTKIKSEFTIPSSTFHPYFYVQDEQGEYLSIEGKKLKKVGCSKPGDVPTERAKYKKTWESDIPFARRYLIDKGIKSGFEVSGTTITPLDVSYNPSVIFFDLEAYPTGARIDEYKDSITAVSLRDNSEDAKVISIVVGIEAFNEKDLLTKLVKILELSDTDILCSYSDYDINLLKARLRANGMHLNLNRTNYFDLLQSYRNLFNKSSYKLRNVAVEEGITTEKQPQLDYKKLFDEDKLELKRINKNHTRWASELDKKHKIISYFWELKSYVGLESIEDTQYSSVLIDTLLLREYLGKYILPTKIQHEKVPYEGAIVLTPQKGIFQGVAVLDMAAYYPNVILSEKLDPTIFYAYQSWKKSGKRMTDFLDELQNMRERL